MGDREKGGGSVALFGFGETGNKGGSLDLSCELLKKSTPGKPDHPSSLAVSAPTSGSQ